MRTVFCEDALEWLRSANIQEGCSIVASLPDISEFSSFSLVDWKAWFMESASLLLSRCPENGVTVFYQSDIKYQGEWVDKSYLCQKAAEAQGARLLWHKIICRAPAGSTTFGRPSYSHVLCFSKGISVDVKRSSPDVIPKAGDKAWERGMGLNACLMIAKFIKEETNTETVVCPFCGMGSMLAAANAMGLNALGIERSPKRAEASRKLRISSDLKSFSNECSHS